MKAISISQPWSWLIVNGIKDIENRNWTTDYRGFILIHAGKKIDVNAFYERGVFGVWPHSAGLQPPMPTRDEYETGGIVGYAMLTKVVTSSDSPWFRGKYGFVLTQRRPVPFIPLRGQLGLFDVPAEIEAQIDAIRDERAIEEDMKDMAQIAREWRDYRLEGDETQEPMLVDCPYCHGAHYTGQHCPLAPQE